MSSEVRYFILYLLVFLTGEGLCAESSIYISDYNGCVSKAEIAFNDGKARFRAIDKNVICPMYTFHEVYYYGDRLILSGARNKTYEYNVRIIRL